MNRRITKLTSIVLTLLILLSVFPVSTFAANSTSTVSTTIVPQSSQEVPLDTSVILTTEKLIEHDTAIANAGVETAIGFTKSINCSCANLWTEFFWERISEGYTVSQSCSIATQDVNAVCIEMFGTQQCLDHGLDSYIIYGNPDLQFEE